MESVSEIQHVVAAVIESAGRFLLCQRPLNKRHGGLWEFPGGKLEPGENHLAAAARELREELDVDAVAQAGVIFSLRDAGSPFVIDFLRVRICGEPRAIEHAAIEWVAPEALEHYALAPSDRAFVAFFLSSGLLGKA